MSTYNESSIGIPIAVVGGGAFLLWLLWRGRGKGGGGGQGGAPAAVEVWIRGGDRVELDGAASDLATTVARARAAGAAHVHTTGDARTGWARSVVGALQAAGVDVGLPPGAVLH